jgi:uncharacterized protein YfbU (UPF0304 family)
VLDKQGKWGESAKCPRNSHFPVLGTYWRMVDAWKAAGRAYELTMAQVDQILKLRSANRRRWLFRRHAKA